jgi:hypothetical protein
MASDATTRLARRARKTLRTRKTRAAHPRRDVSRVPRRRAGAAPALAGLEGAVVATWFTFLPAFALILAVPPFVRRIEAGSAVARAMEGGVGAAVVAAVVRG